MHFVVEGCSNLLHRTLSTCSRQYLHVQEADGRHVLQQLLDGLDHCHQQGIFHRSAFGHQHACSFHVLYTECSDMRPANFASEPGSSCYIVPEADEWLTVWTSKNLRLPELMQ